MRPWMAIAMGVTALFFSSGSATGYPHSPLSSQDREETRQGELQNHVRPKDLPNQAAARWWGRQTYPPAEAVHSISAVYWYEGLIELEDGSRWAARLDSSIHPRSLAYGERVTFRENRRWFATTAFELVLLRTGETLPVSTYQGPLLSSPYLRVIGAVDPSQGLLESSDGSLWELDVRHEQYGVLATWALNDVLMVGHHQNSWGAREFPALLYNCGADSWIPARRVR